LDERTIIGYFFGYLEKSKGYMWVWRFTKCGD